MYGKMRSCVCLTADLKMDIEEAKDAFSAMKFTEVLEALITRFHLPMSVKELYGMVIDDVRRQYAHTVQPVNARSSW